MAEISHPARLIIFDCDGVLVDSEPLSFDCLLAALHEQGWVLSREEAMGRFLGKTVAFVRDSLETATGHIPPADFISRLQQTTLDRFVHQLQPIPGIHECLDGIRQSVCVASSSTPERIRLSLQLTGLLAYFEPHIFSASQVRQGKPAPDLFLHASASMNVEPVDCLVVEDSPSGVQAARAAGMCVVGFTGGGHLCHQEAVPVLRQAGAAAVYRSMEELGRCLAQGPGEISCT